LTGVQSELHAVNIDGVEVAFSVGGTGVYAFAVGPTGAVTNLVDPINAMLRSIEVVR
jgi:hypothetical protein